MDRSDLQHYQVKNMKNGIDVNSQRKVGVENFIYERLPPARLMLNNYQPISNSGKQTIPFEYVNDFPCNCVQSTSTAVKQNVSMPMNIKFKYPYEGILIFSSNKRWSVVMFDESEYRKVKEKELRTAVKKC